MKKILTFIMAWTLFCSSIAYADELNFVVDEDVVINTARHEMYGMNNEWGTELSFWYNDDGTLRQKVLDAVKDYPFTLNRFAGSTSKYLLWKLSRGPVGNRKPYVWGTDRTAGEAEVLKYGLVEGIKPLVTLNPDAPFSFCVNPYFDSVENVADVVEYLTGDGTINYNGGVNWAEVRKQDGLENPVNVVVWELGNESDYQIGIDKYIEDSKRAIAAIRSVQPDAKIAAHTASDDTSTVGFDWHRRVMKELGNDIDFIVLHKYYDHKAVARVAEKLIDDVEADLIDFGLSDRVKILFTEHASGYLGEYKDRFINWPKNHSMSGVLNEGDFFNRMWQHPLFYGACYHGFRVSVWNLVYEDSDGSIKPNAVFDLYKLYNENAIGDIVKIELDNFGVGIAADVSGAAIKTDETLNIFLTNFKTEGDTTIKFDFKGKKYKLVSETVFKADEIYANNYIDRNEISIETIEHNENTALESYELDTLAVVMLKLKEME